jgi:hypothetical protein
VSEARERRAHRVRGDRDRRQADQERHAQRQEAEAEHTRSQAVRSRSSGRFRAPRGPTLPRRPIRPLVLATRAPSTASTQPASSAAHRRRPSTSWAQAGSPPSAQLINGPDTTVGFYKHPFGVVPLRGGETDFRRRRLHLHPPGYRRVTTESFPTVGLTVNTVIPVYLVVASTGDLELFGEQTASTTTAHGSTFRARPGQVPACGQRPADEMPAPGGCRRRRT